MPSPLRKGRGRIYASLAPKVRRGIPRNGSWRGSIFSTRVGSMNLRPHRRRDSVVECASPPALSIVVGHPKSASGLAHSMTWRRLGRFMKSLLLLSHMHWDHEPAGRCRQLEPAEAGAPRLPVHETVPNM